LAATYDNRIRRDTGAPSGSANDRGASWRDRDVRSRGGQGGPNTGRVTTPEQQQQPSTNGPASSSDEWRRRAVRGRTGEKGAGSSSQSGDRDTSSVPRRIIDAIGGPRVYPGDRGGSRDSGSGRGESGSRGSSGNSGSSGSTHSSPPPPPPPSHNDGGGSHNNGGGNSGGEGHVKRDKP
jgi:hypothetical protein